MKIRLVLFAVLGIALMASPVAQAAVTHSSAPNAPVSPDNGCLDDTAGTGLGGITDVIAFVEAGTISDVNVRVEFTQTWRGDIQTALTYTGGGGAVVLANNHGGSADNYYATFDSDAAFLCSDATSGCGAAANCAAAPGPTCQPNQTLNAYDGLTSPGTWTLTTCDRATGDTGNLVAWEVTVDGDGGLPVDLQGFSVN